MVVAARALLMYLLMEFDVYLLKVADAEVRVRGFAEASAGVALWMTSDYVSVELR